MVGIGPWVVKHDIFTRDKYSKLLTSQAFLPCEPYHFSSDFFLAFRPVLGRSQERLRQQSIWRDSNSHVIVHCPAHVFAEPTSDATLSRHHKPLPVEIHR